MPDTLLGRGRVGRADETRKTPNFMDPQDASKRRHMADKSMTEKISAKSKHHIAYLKYIQLLFVNCIPIKLKNRKTSDGGEHC